MHNHKSKIVLLLAGILIVISYVVLFHIIPSEIKRNMMYEDQKYHSDYMILTMQELGYENHYVLSSIYREDAPFGTWYEIVIANEAGDASESGYARFKISVCDVDDAHEGDAVLREYMTAKKDDAAMNYSSHHINLVGHAWNEENIFDYYTDVKSLFSNAERAYVLYDINHIPENHYYMNHIFLKKDRRIISFAYLIDGDFTLNDAHISVIESLFEREIK